MYSLKAVITSISLAGVLALTAAFISSYNGLAMKALQSPANDKGFAVVELFTSEGCSSCPPADELLQRLEKENKKGQLYLLAFHVDYWDHQGWKDRFSDHAFSLRQQQYADWLHLRTVYTPQVVVNGASECIGSDEGAVVRTIAGALEHSATDSLTLNGSINGREAKVTFQATAAEKDAVVVLALVQQSAQSRVRAGENEGRELSHVQIVRGLKTVRLEGNSDHAVSIPLPKGADQQNWELIGFVQHTSGGRITAAARYPLSAGATIPTVRND